MDFLISTHRHLVEGLLLVLLLNLFLPWLFRQLPSRRIFTTRIGYFAFWALWSMVLFSGLIVFVFMKHPMTTSVIAMMLLSLLLPIMDAYRAVRLKRLWLQGEEGLEFSAKVVMAEIILLSAVITLAYIR